MNQSLQSFYLSTSNLSTNLGGYRITGTGLASLSDAMSGHQSLKCVNICMNQGEIWIVIGEATKSDFDSFLGKLKGKGSNMQIFFGNLLK